MNRCGWFVASMLTLSACGVAQAPTEPEVPTLPMPSVSATPGTPQVTPPPAGGEPTAAVEPTDAADASANTVAVAPVTTTPTDAYPGTWLGLCTKLKDCNCSEWSAPATCATALSSGYETGLAQAVAMGLPEEMLVQARMSPAKLGEISNETCPTICEAAAQFNAASRAVGTP
ncbi:MAG: hypothetical protein ACJAZO_001336 [Myxococcota bacterium]|jgi:hypothetical protein